MTINKMLNIAAAHTEQYIQFVHIVIAHLSSNITITFSFIHTGQLEVVILDQET